MGYRETPRGHLAPGASTYGSYSIAIPQDTFYKAIGLILVNFIYHRTQLEDYTTGGLVLVDYDMETQQGYDRSYGASTACWAI